MNMYLSRPWRPNLCKIDLVFFFGWIKRMFPPSHHDLGPNQTCFLTLEHVSGQDEHAHWPKSYVSCWSFSFGVKPPWFWTGPTTFSWEENMCILTRTRFLMIFVDQGNKVQPLQDWSWPSWLKITTAPWFGTKSNTFSMFPDQDEHVHWPESNVFLVTALKFESLQDFAFVWKHD